MTQHTTSDITSADYHHQVERIWVEWEPMLRTAERLLHSGSIAFERDPEGGAQLLRRVQYRAHTSCAFVEAITAPMSASEAHEYLAHTLANVRETMGILAVRVELDELDEHSAELGLQHVLSTRDAFQAARWTGNADWSSHGGFEPYLHEAQMRDHRHASGGMLLWGMAALCSTLLVVLMVQLLVISGQS